MLFKLVVNNPMGARANCIMFMSKDFKYSIRLKNCIMFEVFSIIANRHIFNETIMIFNSVLFYVPSFVIAKTLIWKYKNK